MRFKLIPFIITAFLLSIQASDTLKERQKPTMELSSHAFSYMQSIPVKYTCDGADVSPPLAWKNVPDKTKSIVLIVDDPDAPMGTWVHWIVYDIPPQIESISESQPTSETLDNGAKQGMTSFKKVGYGGPCPPNGTHRYFFKLYALDSKLNLAPGKTKKIIEEAMKGHVLSQTELVGTYSRK